MRKPQTHQREAGTYRRPSFHKTINGRPHVGTVSSHIAVTRDEYELLVQEARKKQVTLGELMSFMLAKACEPILHPETF